MFILLHVLAALGGVIVTSLQLVRPSNRGFFIAKSLVASTLLSGLGLVIFADANVVSFCTSGITYLVFTSALLALAQKRYETTS